MWSLLLAAGCLINADLYESRRVALVDADDDGWTVEDGDCADGDAAVHPGAPEVCDGVDQDCDGVLDEEPTDATVFYADADGDGYGDPSATTLACEAPDGHVANADDCDDTSALAWDGAEEVPWDGVDNDCQGGDLVDVDGDGHDASIAGGDDCDDEDPDVHAGAAETWENGITDNDCDGEREALSESYGAAAITGAEAGAQFGRRLAPLGDVDGDGIDEFVVGAVFASADAPYGGAVYLVDGAGGSTSADFPRLGGAHENGVLGTVAGGADVDGDTVPDLLAAGSNVGDGRGSVWVVSGAAFAATDDAPIEDVASITLIGSDTTGYFGSAVAFLGDLDGDGMQEVSGSAAYSSPGGIPQAGTVGVWSGATVSDGELDDADWLIHGDFEGANLGGDLQAAGDLDGDGYADFMLGGVGELATILPGGTEAPTVRDDALFQLVGHEDGVRCAARMLGDVDGDGEADVGCPMLGGDILLFTALTATPLRTTNAPTWRVELPDESYIFDLLDLGDLDGDGRAETLLPVQTHGTLDTAVAAVLFGEGITYGGSVPFDDLPLRVHSVRPYGAYGYRAISPGDTDGDGHPDLVLAGYADDEGGVEAGGVVVLPIPR
ncbi:MAG: hypothetical protein H6742_11525 [Alphaproteobacteria bacterium]|nr:hypothetical protein [Alphaproteobacteria bacterium]